MAAVSKLAPVVTVLGLVTMLFSFTMLLPLGLSWLLRDGALEIYDKSIAITFGAGFLMWISTRHMKRELAVRDGYLLASLIWFVLPAFATLPLMLHLPDLSFTDAYFETMSGLTTTGATVLTGLDSLPKSINLWRHLLIWVGGMGIIVLAVAIFPLLGIGGMQLYKAETPGPMKDDKLTPRITETAKNLWLVYFVITLACIGSLKLAGMDWFDATCHAFAAMGLGGFSTHDASVGYFNSALIEYVLIIFMLIAGMNFASHFLAWRGKSLRVYLNDTEAKAFLLLVLTSCIGIAWYIWMQGVYTDYWVALRHVSFNLVSLATDCGFVSMDYNLWPQFATFWMLYLSCVSVSSGSTGGGIKMMRTIVTFNQALREMSRQIHPSAIIPVRLGQHVLDNRIVFAIQTFVLVYCTLVLFLTMILMASGLDLVTSISAIIACINNAGPGLNVVGPASNFSPLNDFQTWVCTFAMLVGRLELFTLLVVFTPAFWRK
ncbi:MAG: TrkH family potassium uptake protein [Pseudomonadota bacterium]|nr:TrkH family potassium uptake protein [Pseudomonadota bacterium]